MRPRRSRVRRGWAISIAPLIDVVFLLIIFSMMISHFTRVEIEPVALPEATKGEQPARLPPQRLVINVRRDGAVVLGGRVQSDESLRAALADEATRRPGRDLAVLVRGDRAADWRCVARVMTACAARGIGRVRVAVVEPENGPGGP